jgi:hypothetical protein
VPDAWHVAVRLVPVRESQESTVSIEDLIRKRDVETKLVWSLAHGHHVTLNQPPQRVPGGNGMAVVVGGRSRSHSRLQVLSEPRFETRRRQPWGERVGEKLFPLCVIQRRRSTQRRRQLARFLRRVYAEKADRSGAIELSADGISVRNGVVQRLDRAIAAAPNAHDRTRASISQREERRRHIVTSSQIVTRAQFSYLEGLI